jgi:pimeloyl-ACP methyl ester carboxylesterase
VSIAVSDLFWLVAVLVVFYGGACAYLWSRQRKLIFLPSRELTRTPRDLACAYEDVRVPVGETDVSMHGWWLASPDDSSTVLLYLHGNDFNLGSNVEHIVRLHRLGFSVLAIDYRGYGRSGGAFPSEAQVYRDAEVAFDHLTKQRGIDPRSVIVYGHSLGAAIAIELALRRPALAGVIAESGFTSVSDLAKTLYWMFPVDRLVHQRFDALAKVAKLTVPVLFLHGTADLEVPYTMSERLYAAAPEPKRLALIRGGGHEDNPLVDFASYSRAVLKFVQETGAPSKR